jgi:hypothetical protein
VLKPMNSNERLGFGALPVPPVQGSATLTNVWLVEWLNDDDRRTGRELYEWLNGKRPGWAAYFSCKCKADVFAAIDRATSRAMKTGMRPVLHVESHGCADGISGTNGRRGIDSIAWTELAEPVVSNNSAEACDRLVAWVPCHLCSRFC